ncbi:MAG: lytic transglycosylase domain-containing protein [Myxococcaceae bacterium]
MRLHRQDALSLARAELVGCLGAPSPEADGGAPAPCERAGRLSLLVGYLVLSEGDAEGARAQLSAQSPPKELAGVHAYYLGEAQFYSRDPAAAARSFARAQKKAPSWLAGRLRARLGEALLASGNAVQAAPLLEKAALEAATPELYFQRAIARRAVGNLDGERADLKTLALRFPAHPYGAAALEKLTRQGKKVTFTFDERLTRARAFLEGGDPKASLAELEAVGAQKLARGASANARLSLVRAGARFALLDTAGGEKDLDLAQKGQPAVAAEALMMRARRLLRSSDNRAARALMAEVARRFPKESVAADAGYLGAWLDLQAGRHLDAIKAFEEFEQKHPSSRKRDEAGWFRALALFRLGRHPECALALEALASAFPRSSLVPQARYWATRSRQLGLPKADAADIAPGYEAIVGSFPGSFYAQLSIERLRELGRTPPPLFTGPPRTLPSKVPPELSLALLLSQTGLFRDAADEATSRLAAVRTAEQALAFGHALQSLGEFGDAHTLAVRHLWGAAYGARQPEALALMYPRAFQGAVEREAGARGVDPFLMWAVMRRESAFRPEAASAADARGLLQIIPPTALAIAKQMGSPAPEADALFSPELNIRLAAWYLKALGGRFGHPALTAAAYNAGPRAVVKWAVEKPGVPLDLWVEEIPYRETRGYVKQVVADYFAYHALYGADAGTPIRLELTVPVPADGGVSF